MIVPATFPFLVSVSKRISPLLPLSSPTLHRANYSRVFDRSINRAILILDDDGTRVDDAFGRRSGGKLLGREARNFHDRSMGRPR